MSYSSTPLHCVGLLIVSAALLLYTDASAVLRCPLHWLCVRVCVRQVMSYCLSSSLFSDMEGYMRSAEGQLDSPSADFALQSTQLHAQSVQHFEGQSNALLAVYTLQPHCACCSHCFAISCRAGLC